MVRPQDYSAKVRGVVEMVACAAHHLVSGAVGLRRADEILPLRDVPERQQQAMLYAGNVAPVGHRLLEPAEQ